MNGVYAFREAFLSSDLSNGTQFDELDARQMRYALYWAFYENTAYRNVHRWAVGYRQQQALYKFIRGVYNPTYRLGEFWKAHVWGGRLDLDAGDGREKTSAIPIETENEALRHAIGRVWRWSNWQINKQRVSLYGAVLGDVVLQVVDDVSKGRVYIQPMHPGLITAIDTDEFGNVKGYTLEEKRPHPNNPSQSVDYKETAERSGDDVIYRTYLNNTPYAWGAGGAEWTERYGFIPMVLVKHNDVGLQWGWSEIHSGRGKFQELDDLASKAGDQIRKLVDAPWLFAGVSKPNSIPRASGGTPNAAAPNVGKEETPVLYGPLGANAIPLVAPLPLEATTGYIKDLLAELERDYPELQMDIWNSQVASGRALRIARERVTTKVAERRANYDDSLVRAQAMAVSIGGLRGYADFKGFGLDSWAAGDLEHAIGERSVFLKDPIDEAEVEAAFWDAAQKAATAGMPLLLYLKRAGWGEAQLTELEASAEFQAKLSGLKALAMLSDNGSASGQSNSRIGEPPDAAQ